jgi:hypothetical protein
MSNLVEIPNFGNRVKKESAAYNNDVNTLLPGIELDLDVNFTVMP